MAAGSPPEEGKSMDHADVVYEILLRLPVKTLKRFQCVSTSWFSLISSSQFQLDHFRRAQHNPLLLTLQSEESKYVETIWYDKLTLRFSAYNIKGEFDLVNKFSKRLRYPYFDISLHGKPFMLSCRGLVCISSRTISHPPILVCNPSTQELISLPPTEHPTRCFGFGYAASTQEFKVVSFFPDGKKKIRCGIFTLGTSSWREAWSTPFDLVLDTAPFLHQAFHFMTSGRVRENNQISVIDINTEECREAILVPECVKGAIGQPFRQLSLAKLGGYLCLTFCSGELRELLEVWLLEDYSNVKWVKGYSINVSSVSPTPCWGFGAYLTDTMGDESILLNCYDDNGVKLACYDSQDGTLTLKKDKEWGATYYIESFYPLGSR